MALPKGEIKSIWLPAKIKAALQAWAETKGVAANQLAAALLEDVVLARVMEQRYFLQHLESSGFTPSEYEAPRARPQYVDSVFGNNEGQG